jgi:hypothetical protein
VPHATFTRDVYRSPFKAKRAKWNIEAVPSVLVIQFVAHGWRLVMRVPVSEAIGAANVAGSEVAAVDRVVCSIWIGVSLVGHVEDVLFCFGD